MSLVKWMFFGSLSQSNICCTHFIIYSVPMFCLLLVKKVAPCTCNIDLCLKWNKCCEVVSHNEKNKLMINACTCIFTKTHLSNFQSSKETQIGWMIFNYFKPAWKWNLMVNYYQNPVFQHVIFFPQGKKSHLHQIHIAICCIVGSTRFLRPWEIGIQRC